MLSAHVKIGLFIVLALAACNRGSNPTDPNQLTIPGAPGKQIGALSKPKSARDRLYYYTWRRDLGGDVYQTLKFQPNGQVRVRNFLPRRPPTDGMLFDFTIAKEEGDTLFFNSDASVRVKVTDTELVFSASCIPNVEGTFRPE